MYLTDIISENSLGAYIEWKYSPKHDHGAQGGGSPWCIPMNKVSLNDAFLVRWISEGPTRDRCHVTAIDIIGRRTPNSDPEVSCCKIWSKIVSYLYKLDIWPKYGILSQWRLLTKLNKTSQCVLAVLFYNCRNPVCDFLGVNHWMKTGVKPNCMIIQMLTVHCLTHIFRKLLWP